MIRTTLAAALLGSTILLAACNQAPETPAANEAAASIIEPREQRES